MFYNLRSGSCFRILVCVLEIDECDLIVFGIISAQIGIISAQIGIFCDPFCVLVIGIISTKIGMWFNRIHRYCFCFLKLERGSIGSIDIDS